MKSGNAFQREMFKTCTSRCWSLASSRLLLLICLGRARALAPAIAFSVTPFDCVQPAAIFGLGDAVAQQMSRKGQSLAVSRKRLSSSMSIGAVYGGIVVRFVYVLAESLFPGVTVANTLLKATISISILSSGGNWLSMFLRRFLPGGAFARKQLPLPWPARCRRCYQSVNQDFYGVLRHDLKVWPLFDVVCFSAIPPHLRPTAVAIMQVCWHTYVSYVSSQAAASGGTSSSTESEDATEIAGLIMDSHSD